ncbi:MAG: Mrp/NBP35 family ATP-binding protein, partial [SAR202 cluster bacterium]|nr:Mrp/NBP35 family ATP-binding protein [SAR202 cluster bacterium]
EMFQKVNVPILGIVENMSAHICSSCGHEDQIFGAAGGKRLSEQYGLPFLGSVPLDTGIMKNTDEGDPSVVSEPESPVAASYRDIALRASGELAASGKDYSRLFPTISVKEDE